jgi:hypothetical protein
MKIKVNQNGNNKHVIDCVGCQQRFSLDMPTPQAVNLPTVSTAIATHEKLIKCPKCGQAYFWAIQRVYMEWGVVPVSEEDRRQIEGSNIISLVK